MRMPWSRRSRTRIAEPTASETPAAEARPAAAAQAGTLVADVPGAPAPAPEPVPADRAPEPTAEEAYKARLQDELDFHKDYTDISALPAIAGYWATECLLPWLKEAGADDPDQFFVNALFTSAERTGSKRPVFASIGAGNCDTEIRFSKMLTERGLTDFRFECVDINPHMLERGRQEAAEAGLADVVIPVEGDFNDWRPERRYDAVLANQALHHVVELETLYDRVKEALLPGASFVVSDMIGRNGHLRWPEALEPLQRFWQELPESYRYNLQLNRHEGEYENWDCSAYGFEGIRAQDVLPLLVERFEFETFIGFGNVIDVFVDRCFGHHFNPASERDRAFVDKVHAFDEEGFASGSLTPTHMIAVLRNEPVERPYFARGLSPSASVRDPARV